MNSLIVRQLLLCLSVFFVALNKANIIAEVGGGQQQLQQQISQAIGPLVVRLKRAAEFEEQYYDENGDIIPELVDPPQRRLEDVLQEHAEKITADFKEMWQTLSDTLRQCYETIKRHFSDDGSDESAAHEAASMYQYVESPWQNGANHL